MKTCKYCGDVKSESEFYKSKPGCMVCVRKRTKVLRQTEHGRKLLKKYYAPRYTKFHEKYLARGRVGAAIKSGKLIKPSNCESCGRELKLEGHHDDYSKPLEVNWLCNPCHKARHGRLVDIKLIINTESPNAN